MYWWLVWILFIFIGVLFIFKRVVLNSNYRKKKKKSQFWYQVNIYLSVTWWNPGCKTIKSALNVVIYLPVGFRLQYQMRRKKSCFHFWNLQYICIKIIKSITWGEHTFWYLFSKYMFVQECLKIHYLVPFIILKAITWEFIMV